MLFMSYPAGCIFFEHMVGLGIKHIVCKSVLGLRVENLQLAFLEGIHIYASIGENHLKLGAAGSTIIVDD